MLISKVLRMYNKLSLGAFSSFKWCNFNKLQRNYTISSLNPYCVLLVYHLLSSYEYCFTNNYT